MAKLGAMARLRKRRAARLEAKRQVAVAALPPAPEPEPAVDPKMLEGVRVQVKEAHKMARSAFRAPKLVKSGRADVLLAEANEKEAVLVKMEAAAAAPVVVPVSDVKVALTVFDHAVVILTVGTEILKISKWYAVGGAAAVAGLFFLAEKQGWLDFINF
jgi:hypothetical protein